MTRLLRFAPLLGLVCLFFTVPAHADTMYTVNGTITLVGNDACGSPCTQTINFSFDLGWQYDQTFNTYLGYATDLVANWSGVLATFTGNSVGPINFGPAGYNYLKFLDPSGDVLELYLYPASPVPAPTVPSFGATLYSCGSATCVTDFWPPYLGPPPTTLPTMAIFLPASVTYTVTTPEPATLGLLAIGMLALGLVGAFSRKVRPQR